MQITGYWFEPDNSTRLTAQLVVSHGQYSLSVDSEQRRQGADDEFSVSDRLGTMPRQLSWPDGAVFETQQNDEVDAWLVESGRGRSGSLIIHWLERSWIWAICALVLMVGVSYSGFRWGLPAASEAIAYRLPQSVNTAVSSQAMTTLDRFLFSETSLSVKRQAEVNAQFETLLESLPEHGSEFTLHFRSMDGIANAMALPGGDIVVTDAFVEMVEHPQELDSVLLHEIGHVLQHHGMTQVIRASAVSVIASLAFGDLSAMGEVAVGLPIFMMQNSYSRQHETAADSFAFEHMLATGKDPKYFASIITRLTNTEFDPDNPDTERKQSYFSSHPDSQARALRALEVSTSSGVVR